MGDLKGFRDGMNAYSAGDYASAVRMLGPLSERRGLPGRMARYYCAMAHRAMGVEAISDGDFPAAGRHLQRAVGLIGNRAELAEYLLVAYAGTGQYDRCAAQADVLCQARPSDAEARVCLAHAQWRSGRRQEAVMTLTRALRRLGDRADLHLDLGLFHAADGRLDEARHHLARAVECDCTSVSGWRRLALVESARGDFQQAVRAFQRALALDAGDLMTTYQLCLAADAASRDGRRVVVSLPEVNRGSAASEIRRLAEYVLAEPDFVEAFLALPASDVDGELFGVVLSVLRMALTIHDDYADVHYLTAAALSRLGDAGRARQHARRALQINPHYVKALLLRAELDAQCGACDRAAACLQRAVDAGADWPDVHTRLGDLLRRTGRAGRAREHYSRALQLNRTYAPAAAGLKSLAA